MTTALTARISGRQLGAGIGLGIGLAVVLGVGTSLIAKAAGWADSAALTLLIVAEAYLAVIAGLVLAVGGPAGAVRLLALRRPTARQVGSSFALLAASLVAGFAVTLALSPLTGGVHDTLTAVVRDGSDQARMATATPLVWALIVIRLLALAGTAEELLFRGALYGWLRRRLPVGATIVVTSLLFAVEHAYYPILLPLVVCLGLALGWARHRTHSTVTTIAMHVVVDFAFFFAAIGITG